jgi:hypothetical protein
MSYGIKEILMHVDSGKIKRTVKKLMASWQCILIKGSLVHVARACAGSGEGSDHFGSYVRSLSLHFCKRMFLGLEPMTTLSQGNNFTAAPGLPFVAVHFNDLQ